MDFILHLLGSFVGPRLSLDHLYINCDQIDCWSIVSVGILRAVVLKMARLVATETTRDEVLCRRGWSVLCQLHFVARLVVESSSISLSQPMVALVVVAAIVVVACTSTMDIGIACEGPGGTQGVSSQWSA